MGLARRAILGLLIKTRQCCRLSDSNRMCSALCQWGLQLEDCWTNHSDPTIVNLFHFCFFRRPKLQINLAITCVCCGYHCSLHFFFHAWSSTSHCHNTSQATKKADMFRQSRQTMIIYPAFITVLTALHPLHVVISFALTLSLLPSRIDHP